VLRKAYGLANLELRVPLSPDLVFPICSITKQMTSLLALLVADEGALDLETSVGAYIPELPPIARRPTLRQLMTHQSGLRCFVDSIALDPLRSPRPDRFGLGLLSRLDSVNTEPGAWQVYCPSGHFLLSIAMERATGQSFPDLCAHFLFDRLGLGATHQADFPKAIIRDSPSHYSATPDGRWELVTQDRFECLGEGGFYSTADDLLAWSKALRIEDDRVPRRLWRALKAPPSLPNGQPSHYALGLQVTPWRGELLLGHGGGSPGIATHLLASERHELDIVVLANSEAPSGLIALKIFEHLAGVAALAPAPVPVAAARHSGLPGAIFASSEFLIEFGEREDKLTAGVLGNPPALLLEPDRSDIDFIQPALTTAFEYRVTEGGSRLRVRANGETHECARIDQTAPTTEEIAESVIGVYEHDALESWYRFHRQDDRLLFSYHGRYGYAEGDLLPVSLDLLKILWPPAAPYFLCARLIREAGQVRGFAYSTSRTRNLVFRKRVSVAVETHSAPRERERA
jgi:CubicO group peptidase (beta-lactamase class C family)